MQVHQEKIKLTEYSHGAGCGCKIAPDVLDQILHKSGTQSSEFTSLLVGNKDKDDAAVWQINDNQAVISTTDFFMPIVDDPFTFGKIAATNAISDIYAMGGSPIMAIAILGWPVDKLSPDIAGEVIAGARETCLEAGIPLAGGHSIDCPEPIFGLSVNGLIDPSKLKRNGGDISNCVLYLTKALGVGIIATAQKKGMVEQEHLQMAIQSMTSLNKIGMILSEMPQVKAMTDVTGFGLLGHLIEMCESSHQSAVINFEDVPFIDREVLNDYLDKKCVPGGTNRNFRSYGHKLNVISEQVKNLLCDPQTSGGLLVAVEAAFMTEFESKMKENGFILSSFGRIIPKNDHVVNINEA